MPQLREKSDIHPKCPHCSKEVKEVWFRELKNMLGKRYIYFCSNCHNVLGISHRKGFFMG
jgi:hypothetical protein